MGAIERLKIKLKITDASEDDILNECLQEALDELLNYLNVTTLENRFASKQIELAKIYYLKDYATDNTVKAESYSEGGVSESTTYTTNADYDNAIASLFNSIQRYRRVYVKDKTEDSGEEE